MILTGVFRLGRDSELRYTPNGDAVTNLSLAYNYGRRDGEGKRPTQWVNAALYGKRAESLNEYLVKGAQISAVIDEVHTEKQTGSDGTVYFNLVGRVANLELVGSRAQGDQEGHQAAQNARPAPKPAPAAQRPAAQPNQAAQSPPATGLNDIDDDLPF